MTPFKHIFWNISLSAAWDEKVWNGAFLSFVLFPKISPFLSLKFHRTEWPVSAVLSEAEKIPPLWFSLFLSFSRNSKRIYSKFCPRSPWNAFSNVVNAVPFTVLFSAQRWPKIQLKTSPVCRIKSKLNCSCLHSIGHLVPRAVGLAHSYLAEFRI